MECIVTNCRTVHDHLPMAEINALLASGQIGLSDLSDHVISAWAAWEPPPIDLTRFALADRGQREEFLYQYCAQGEASLFTAVAHIWSWLAEPREARCTAMGIACGAGGKGKLALVHLLKKLLDECLDDGAPMPRSHEYEDLDAWHQAAMTCFTDDELRMRQLCARYASILDGSSAAPQPPAEGDLVSAPWLASESTS